MTSKIPLKLNPILDNQVYFEDGMSSRAPMPVQTDLYLHFCIPYFSNDKN